ncbi:hypothetical protein SAMN03159496_04637 [Rhizobium sp. NFR07]|uniref:hypothetical protein n=1 Tax=Rhizobium sp. NFR07 TaxID=1566262 RepID=UPI0008E01B96|nr:hypothetical protein [Rhizobium sp. NFR07]SFB52344.1 hypothetical protein SAMN03159496_04637 [Rhizobium sp. NFR07]
MAVVIKPFDFASDGFTIESLVTGDERDFGAATDGLVGEGFISVDVEADAEDGEGAPQAPKKRGK